MATEQFSLRWNNFHSNLTSGFHDLMQANDMVDVTLAVEGQFLQAHKIVLSICSPLFKQLFKINPCKHPVIILRDVTYRNLKDILAFMYLGEVNVLRDNLSTFLRTAELLQVKGLTSDDSSDTSSKKDDKSDSTCDNEIDQDIHQFNQMIASSESTAMPNYTSQLPSSPPHAHSVKRTFHNASGQSKRSKSEQLSSITSVPIVEKHERSETPIQIEDDADYVENTNCNREPWAYGSENDEISPNKEVIQHFLECNNVNMSSSQDSSSQDHGRFEIRIKKRPYKCIECKKRFSRRDHLRTHEKNIHGENAGPFACVICSQLYKNSESLRKHIAKFHYYKIHEMCNLEVPKVII